MTRFFPVYVRRSDGKLTVSKSTHGREDNAPLPEQLDASPNAQGVCDYYRECQPGEGKEVDWRRKLGGMLVRELGTSDHKDKNFILAALPENYRLFEHVRHKTSEANEPPQKPVKNHAAGSNERQDAYLYGHPQGRKKRYRSPAEYFPHLLWLATDEAGDPNNCSCKFCSPEELETDDKAKPSAKDLKQNVVQPNDSAQGGKSTSITNAPKGSQTASSSSLPRFRNKEQKLDLQYNQFLYRPGELIWFQRDQSSWGLAAIMSREGQPNNPRLNRYRVQPLSHPLSHRPSVVCTQHELRPWLAWSPPPCIAADLNPTSNNVAKIPTYFTVDWLAYCNGGLGEKNAEIDGSILMAKYVETTYTLFERIESKTSTREAGQTSEIYYNGLFYGSEKIWLGDPLRLRSGANPGEVMVAHNIIEHSNPSNSTKSQVVLTGDIYSQSLVSDANQNPISSSADQIPQRLQEDLKVRNAVRQRASDPSKRGPYFWKLEAKNAQRVLAEIKGRWYESSLLLPIFAPAKFEADQQKGEMGDVTSWMNGQGDCNKPVNAGEGAFKPADEKLKRREEAFNKAVPTTFRIRNDLDERSSTSSTSAASKASNAPSKHAHVPPSAQQQHQRLVQQQNIQHYTQPVVKEESKDSKSSAPTEYHSEQFESSESFDNHYGQDHEMAEQTENEDSKNV